MHGPFDKSPKDEPNIYQNWSMKLFALPLLLAIAMIGYVVSHPNVAKRVADGVRTDVGTRMAPASQTHAAQTSNQTRPGR